MQVDDFQITNLNEDLTQILPIQQKRTIALVNHFIMQTVSYLNNFAQSCESRFMEFEYKIQKLEASILILESQLNSIPGLNDLTNLPHELTTNDLDTVDTEKNSPASATVLTGDHLAHEPIESASELKGIPAKKDPRYMKFFKMLQFGVPEPAVKLKMQNEGVDPTILDKPNDIIPGLDPSVSEGS